MDRPEPGLIRWSPNAGRDLFLHINLQHHVVQLHEPTGFARKGKFESRTLGKYDELPPLTTFDWSPSVPGLVAVGTSTGVVNILRVDDNSNAVLDLNLKMSRTCQAVAFSTAGKLAVALDRVRSDNCLYIWDVNRLSTMDTNAHGFSSVVPFTDPIDRLEPNQNYFASSALDQPGVMVWDRRATHRQVARPSYNEAVKDDDLPWGGALRLEKAVRVLTQDPAQDTNTSYIRSIRFCRDKPGMLGVLSRAGQLRILDTRHEYVEPSDQFENSPELLEVARSYEMDPFYLDNTRHKHEKIVSFDWITMPSPIAQARMLVLRKNGNFDVLEKPSFTSEYPFKLIPWQAPHRGLEGKEPPEDSSYPWLPGEQKTHNVLERISYHQTMDFEIPQTQEILGPFLTEKALANKQLFGPDKANLTAVVEDAMQSDVYTDLIGPDGFNRISDLKFPEGYSTTAPIAEKLAALRMTVGGRSPNGLNTRGEPLGQLERHENLLMKLMDRSNFPREAQVILDHTMIFRAKEGYLFNYRRNQQIVADDPWLQDMWAWITGSKPQARLSDHSHAPDQAGWERCLNAINKKLGLPKFDGVDTKRPHHREMCLEMCKWGRNYDADLIDGQSTSSLSKDASVWHTMAAAQALFRGDTRGAVQVLKQASTDHPELLFVSLALQLVGNVTQEGDRMNKNNAVKEALDFDERVASKTDPYLRAISSIIATGDWLTIANQRSLPLRDRVYVAVRYLPDDALTVWLRAETEAAMEAGNIEGIVLTGITDPLVDILARYVSKFGDFQTATLALSICSPRFVDDVRAAAFRTAYRAYLQRHHAFFLRAKFDVESTKRSKHQGRPTLRPPGRQIALRCVYCDASTSLHTHNNSSSNSSNTNGHLPGNASPSIPSFMVQHAAAQQAQAQAQATAAAAAAAQQQPISGTSGSGGGGVTTPNIPIPPPPPPPDALQLPPAAAAAQSSKNPFTEKMVQAGISCPNCKRHLPRCVVCLEIVGMPRSDLSGSGGTEGTGTMGRGGPGGSGTAAGGGYGGGAGIQAGGTMGSLHHGGDDHHQMSAVDMTNKMAARFPTFCLQCEHVLHLDHAREWFARHQECPVPECRSLSIWADTFFTLPSFFTYHPYPSRSPTLLS
ncbi:hypothetical protein NEUTE1DRAFT_122147 [Neurospora tetrasperma FGSC 2508]|uniref:Uncharacterized protein n=1 Tax=Neurospora tetrasperma (strain FGSC 2508 / ATCC MYA-4615 / P0657) TaxID=510951 RepID=F8MMB4_NEUT8|nr:uncharacterized protein NEUTE1DRAFT_122147 [Neurospora tetrasperma FGSC 2508]EGO57788.1 hypothetical protein NEUTE1DRAFT_122147 [Neurospora tetrasperma FGSC 2508]